VFGGVGKKHPLRGSLQGRRSDVCYPSVWSSNSQLFTELAMSGGPSPFGMLWLFERNLPAILVAQNPGRVELIDGSPCFDGRLYGAFGHLHLSKGSMHISGTILFEKIRRCLSTTKNLPFKRCKGKKYRTVFSSRTVQHPHS